MRGVRITPSDHRAGPVQSCDPALGPEELMQDITLGKKLVEWRDQLWIKKRNERQMRNGSPPSSTHMTEDELEKPHVEIFQSSFDTIDSTNGDIGEARVLQTSENGLVWSLIHAYSQHHHLTIRPEDLWFAILTQFNAYLNAHAEEFRHVFVSHVGRKELVVSGWGTRYTVDFGRLTDDMGRLIQENILDDGLREWIMPNFSTTTKDDKVLASVLMMAMMQRYFEYTMCLMCGFPSVTLLGRREDYEQILKKLDRLDGFGDEPIRFACLLRPILKRFISSFDNPSAPEVLSFWQRAVHKSGGSGPTYYSGWVSAFCFWDKDGKRTEDALHRRGQSLELDGVEYGSIKDRHVPSGYATVPVKVDDNGVIIKAQMTAGSVGIACSKSGRCVSDGTSHFDSMQPVTAWWISEAVN